MTTRLSAGGAEITIDQENGCRVSGLRVDGIELLRQGPKYGAFPMVPWCGRTANGRFHDGAAVHQLPLNHPPHAIHGFARDAPWKTASATGTTAAFTYDLTDPWPYSGRVTQLFELGPDALTIRLGVETYQDSFPAQAGWHPWFNRVLTEGGEPARIGFDPAWQEERDEDHIPTGRRTDPKPGPWDDCFGMPYGVDVSLTWPGQLELKVTSPAEWVVVYDEQPEAVCVEPQSGPPNGLNTLPRLVTPVDPLEVSTTWTWRRLG
ncbi:MULTISPECIES: aldose 1-epimerase [Streptomyces]|uniref:Aldose 1-epimerase n=1 Tax=Streptomyces katrae TaxID=68223 RepID=A0ABT7GWQ1_9ACTN|nr:MULTISPECIES: aldose 1-epimerase [Streptomyces]MDK9497988.1 aldose 1-epimerase [Streptomyces katrae]RST08216.1 aldose 1-epimerase [Streptomyces sp. WAC07149]GLX20747.1 aldose 1-epimerase [Streptomyces lavendulae subsp. lavendulae]GLX28091.1 aldose 1-epimerase [Streptomyces lavendulae subsp. lavendulae]